jgi:hypothetical protein
MPVLFHIDSHSIINCQINFPFLFDPRNHLNFERNLSISVYLLRKIQ